MTMLIECGECGTKISDRSENCPNCGAPNTQIACGECENIIPRSVATCLHCGAPQSTIAGPKSSVQHPTTLQKEPTSGSGFSGWGTGTTVAVVLALVGVFSKPDADSLQSHAINRIHTILQNDAQTARGDEGFGEALLKLGCIIGGEQCTEILMTGTTYQTRDFLIFKVGNISSPAFQAEAICFGAINNWWCPSL